MRTEYVVLFDLSWVRVIREVRSILEDCGKILPGYLEVNMGIMARQCKVGSKVMGMGFEITILVFGFVGGFITSLLFSLFVSIISTVFSPQPCVSSIHLSSEQFLRQLESQRMWSSENNVLI